MRMRLFGISVLTAGGLAFGMVPGAKAQGINVGDFASVLFRGAEFAGDPLFLSSPQGGPLFDFNDFTQRVEFNRAGQGFTYEFFRFFGPDSFGNVNTLDLGPFKLEIGPDGTLGQAQRVGLHSRTGFTTTFIPEVFFQAETGQRNFNQFSGVTNFSTEPLRYRATFNTGIQDFEWAGNMLIDTDGRINALGFYDFTLRLTNVGSATADGVALQNEEITDFDVGPINVSGNIGLDIISGLLQASGLTPAAAPTRIASGAAQREKSVEELLAQLEAGEGLTDEEAQFLIQQMFITAFQSDPLGFILNGIPDEVPGFEALTLGLTADGPGPSPNAVAAAVPEPGTMLLVALGLALPAMLRPGHRRRRAAGLL
jgi:hypothetical protein